MSVATKAPTHGAALDTYSTYAGEGPHWTSDPTAEVPIRYANSGLMSEKETPSMTIPQLMKLAVDKSGGKPALRVERPLPPLNADGTAPQSAPLENWTTWSFADYYKDVECAARGFISLGLPQFGTVTVFGFNAPEWHISAMASIFAGAKPAGIYPTDTTEVIAYKTNHSNAQIAVVEDEGKFRKYCEIAEELTSLQAIVCWGFTPKMDSIGPSGSGGTIRVLHWEQVMAAGRDEGGEHGTTLAARLAGIRPGHCAALIYTSGTTGNPKAVMTSHDNFYAEAMNASQIIEGVFKDGQQERIISYLPLSHVAGMMCDIMLPLVGTATQDGYCTAHFARPYDLKASTIGDRLRAVKPTVFLGIPRVWEKIADKVKAIGASTKGLKKKVATFAKGRGLLYNERCLMGGSGKKPKGYFIANKVLGKIAGALGLQECKFALTSAAPIGKETLEYYGSLGISICEAYGMSECSGVTTFSNNSAHLWGSCGWSMYGFETRVFNVDPTDLNKKVECVPCEDIFAATDAQQGEICYRGRHIMMGYYANPAFGEMHVAEIAKKNAEAIDAEGYLHSGDKGTVDTRGNVKITGRYKELIIGSGGENIAPVPIEDNVKKLCPALSNFMMVGDKRKFNVALVTLKAVGATGEAPGGNDLEPVAIALDPSGSVKTITAAMDSKAVIDAIHAAIVATNGDGTICPSNAAKIQKFTILPIDFSQEGAELTPTLKTKRSMIEKKYAAAIEAMYAEGNTGSYVKFIA